jgi:DNA-binding MarR family transcriptional regulator
MVANKDIDLAWQIFTNGRKIHEWIFQLENRYMIKSGVGKAFGEFSFAQMRTLKFVKTRGQVSITELAELLNVSAPSASTMVERLVERSVLVRKPDPADRRKVIVTVSPDMVAIAEQIEKEIFGAFVDLVNKVGPDVADDWCQVLDRITEVLDSDMQSSQAD